MPVTFALAIPIGSIDTDKLPTPLLGFNGAGNLPGYVPAVGVVDDVFQRHDQAILRLHRCLGVEVVVDSHEPDAQKREDPQQVVAGFVVVTAEAGQVLDHDAVNLPAAYIFHHALKIRAVEVGSGVPVIAVDLHQPQVGLTLNICQNQVSLPLNRVRAGLAAVLNGEANIGSGLELLCLWR